MANYTSEQIRNISLIGHGTTGKTIFAESMLYISGAVNRFGKIEEGNTVSDYHKDEIEKQISINSSILNTNWKNSKGELRKINIIDTPGYTDFLGEVKSSLRVTDTSILLIDSFKGREVGTELSFHYTNDYENNIVFVINKLDQENSEFDKCIEQLKESFGSEVAVVQFPVNPGPNFDAVVDVARMKLLRFKTDGKGEFTEEDIPEALKEKANEYHKQFVEVIAAEEDSLMEKFFENDENLPDEDIRYGLHKGMMERKFFPVFCASGKNSIGVRPVLDFIADFCESPLEKPAEKGHRPNSEESIDVPANTNGEPCMFIFKTISEKNIGELSFFRVYSGSVKPGMDLINEANGKTERLSQLYFMNGKDRKEVPEVLCGDIGAVVKLKDSHTNNTLSSKGFPVVLNYTIYPEPNMTLAIFPKKKGEEDKIAAALHTLHEEDPTFIVSYNTETHQTLISGQGEMHLNVIVNRIKSKFGLEVEVLEPKIPYRETIRATVKDAEYKHKKQSGGHGQYGHVHIRLEPNERGAGFEFINEIVGGVIPGKYIPAVEKGIQEVMVEGVLAGYPVVDVKVALHFGSYHDVDSSDMSFKIAGSQAFRKGFRDAKPVLLEPIFDVEVIFPEEFMGAVSGDISSRRGRIAGMDSEGHMQLLKCQIPLSEMGGYSSKLRSLTQGRGTYRRKFSHYEDVPKDVEVKIVAEYEKNRAEGN
ncbi:MAG: elongation factor G [Ignavibacteria bacterium]|nr:elongation factor G [Ignavibacteria bacterium]